MAEADGRRMAAACALWVSQKGAAYAYSDTAWNYLETHEDGQ